MSNGKLQHHTIVVNAIHMHYVTVGSGPLMILLHGFPEFWYSWRHQLSVLGSHFTVVAPDLRGYNETDKPPFLWDYHIDVLMRDILDLILSLGHDHAIIVGHDWGGLLAWHVSIHFPHAVDRLIILNAPHPILFADAMHFNPVQMFRSSYVSFFQLPWLPEQMIKAHDFALLEQTFRNTSKGAFTDEDIRLYKDALRKPGALTAALNWYRAYVFLGGNLKTFFGSRKHTHSPTLLIWGEQDRFLGKELTKNLDKYVADLHTCYLRDCSHWVQQECPDTVNRCIEAFLGIE